MTQDFTKRLVDHRGIGLAAERITEFPFHHGERGFDVRALVIMGQKFLFSEREIVVHLLPRPAAIAAIVGLERDERSSADTGNYLCIRLARIALVCRYFRDLKILGRVLNQCREHDGIVCISIKNLYRGHDVRLDSDHDVNLYPVMLLADLSVLVVKPAGESAGGKTGRIHGKVGLHGLERQTGLCDELLQNRSQIGVLKVVADAVKVRSLGNVPAPMRFSQVGHESALRNRTVDLEHDIEHGIGERQTRTAILARSGYQSRAQVVQEALEPVLFARLRRIVRGPVLRVGSALFRNRHGSRHSRASVRVLFLSDLHDTSRNNVLASLSPALKVRARTTCPFLHQVDTVRSAPGFRRDNPKCSLPPNRPRFRQFHAANLSQVHNHHLRNILLNRYILVKRNLTLTIYYYLGIVASWRWSRSSKKAIAAIVANTNGCRAGAPRVSRKFVHRVKAH